MAPPSEHTEQSSTTTDNNMLSTSAVTTGSGAKLHHPPTFNGLPTELKKLIVHHAEDSCLANLRLANKELNAIATKPFGKRLLAERRFMLSEYSLQSLVDLTAHPVFGKQSETCCMLAIGANADHTQSSCVRKILFSTHVVFENFDGWYPANSREDFSEADHHTLWKVQTIEQNFVMIEKTGRIKALLNQALCNLKAQGNRIKLGIFDDVIHGADHDLLRKAYGFDKLWADISPLCDLEPKQWLPAGEFPFLVLMWSIEEVSFPVSPLELDLASGLRMPYGGLDQMLDTSSMVKTQDGMLQRNVDICIKRGPDSTFRFFRLDAAVNARVVFGFKGTAVKTDREEAVELDFIASIVNVKDSFLRYDFGSGSCSYYSSCAFGHFNQTIGEGNVSDFRMSSCATEAHYLLHNICKVGGMSLQQLVLTDLHLFDHVRRRFLDENNSAWPYIDCLHSMLSSHCPNLRTLVMERMFYHADDEPRHAVILGERREWKGVGGALSGLASLIDEMTTLNLEQREKWWAGEIDADGNNVSQDH